MSNAPAVTISGDQLVVHFNRFDATAYPLFLRVKALPEFNIEFVREDDSYVITAPARFAAMLGVRAPGIDRGDLPFPAFLFDDQLAILRLALRAKRYACWSDCGLGKSLVEFEFGRQVIHRTSKKFLLFSLNEIVNQLLDEATRFYGDTLPIVRLASREAMKAWCAAPVIASEPMFAITNYEKMNHKGEADQVVNELRNLGGIALDEASRLKGSGGRQKWALIKSCRGIEYKLSCTATPAPNDTIEFASQASFLEKMRSDADIIWTYFHRDPKSHRWTVKRHAREAFFEFMSAWSIYVRDPRRYGWRLNHPDIPTPDIQQHRIQLTDEQREAMQKLSIDPSGQMSLLATSDTNAIQRSKLSQIAKGFRYIKGKSGSQRVHRIASDKPIAIADLIQREVADGLQVLVWTVFDAESDILVEQLRRRDFTEFDLLTGKTADSDRLEMLDRFRHGESRVLISRAQMLGYGMNFQCCGSMIFSGWSDSYEAHYQAVRRAHRYGQDKTLRVHIPYIEELEGAMLENILHKQDKHEAAIAEMEQNYIAAVQRTAGSAA